MTAVRKQIKLEEDEDAAQLKFPSEFKTADALLISEVHMLLKVKFCHCIGPENTLLKSCYCIGPKNTFGSGDSQIFNYSATFYLSAMHILNIDILISALTPYTNHTKFSYFIITNLGCLLPL